MNAKSTDQAAINAAILERLEKLNRKIEQARRPNTLERLRDLIFGHKIILLVFFLGAAMGGSSVLLISEFGSNPSRIVCPVRSPKEIAQKSPNDTKKRETIASEYKTAVEQIRQQIFKTPSEAIVSVRMATAPVRFDPAWKSTVEELDRFIDLPNDLFETEIRFGEIATAFGEATP